MGLDGHVDMDGVLARETSDGMEISIGEMGFAEVVRVEMSTSCRDTGRSCA